MSDAVHTISSFPSCNAVISIFSPSSISVFVNVFIDNIVAFVICFTVISYDASFSLHFAFIVVVPAATGLTVAVVPFPVTVATPVFVLVHVTVPEIFVSVAVNVAVSFWFPIIVIVVLSPLIPIPSFLVTFPSSATENNVPLYVIVLFVESIPTLPPNSLCTLASFANI